MKYNDIKKFSRGLRKHQTPCEKRLWERLKNRQVLGFKFLRQHPIMYDRQGNDLNFFIPDFYCSKARLVIEVDGGIHDDKSKSLPASREGLGWVLNINHNSDRREDRTCLIRNGPQFVPFISLCIGIFVN
jgi:hypothetical protein